MAISLDEGSGVGFVHTLRVRSGDGVGKETDVSQRDLTVIRP